MAHLLRIVMIHGHLNGVVELSVDGYTNTGTNASVKPRSSGWYGVYGELPNKVVLKTRMKFDAFYLPHRNSYLVMNTAMKRATCAGGADPQAGRRRGVSLRRCALPGRLPGRDRAGPLALDYTQWASGRRSGAGVTQAGATSEFRSVIQNDFTQLHGNSRDGLKLRQIAAQFSLVNPSGDHIESWSRWCTPKRARWIPRPCWGD